MPLGACATFAKYCLFFFNFIFFIGGLGALGVGIWLAADPEAVHTLLKFVDAIQIEDAHEWHEELTPNVLAQAAYILIAAGSAVFLISFLGCCGAIRESSCCLSLYAVALIVILGLEVAAGIYAAVEKQKLELHASTAMKRTLTEYYTGNANQDGVTWGWNKMMVKLQCCGTYGYNDFNDAYKWTGSRNNRKIPEQCCKMKDGSNIALKDEKCPEYPNSSNSNMYMGCYEALKKVLQLHLTIVMAVGLGIGCSQILGIFLAFVLCCTLDRYK